ncbi:KdsC family phosphatase [Thermodesulfobacteriota bacterium]
MIKKLSLKQIDAIIFDFDGVLTDNRVYIDQNGREMVCCHRGDGLAFDVLRKKTIKLFILSTENNPVVSCRGKKLKVPVFQGVNNKLKSIKILLGKENINLEKVMFVGNDLNDYNVMKVCGIAVCPSDSHPRILDVASIVLETKGGHGVVREIVERVLGINIIKELD